MAILMDEKLKEFPARGRIKGSVVKVPVTIGKDLGVVSRTNKMKF